MEIRRLTIDDYEEIIKLWERSGLPFKPKGRDSRHAIAKQMRTEPNFFLGAFQGKTLVGTVVGSYDGRKGCINRLAVAPKHRRRGVAQLLVTSMEKILEKKGAAVLFALVEEPNKESVNLFEKLGYVTDRSILYLSKRKSQDV